MTTGSLEQTNIRAVAQGLYHSQMRYTVAIMTVYRHIVATGDIDWYFAADELYRESMYDSRLAYRGWLPWQKAVKNPAG